MIIVVSKAFPLYCVVVIILAIATIKMNILRPKQTSSPVIVRCLRLLSITAMADTQFVSSRVGSRSDWCFDIALCVGGFCGTGGGQTGAIINFRQLMYTCVVQHSESPPPVPDENRGPEVPEPSGDSQPEWVPGGEDTIATEAPADFTVAPVKEETARSPLKRYV